MSNRDGGGRWSRGKRGVEAEVEQAAQVPKACKVEDQWIKGLEAGTVEDEVGNEAQILKNLLFIRRSSSFYQ